MTGNAHAELARRLAEAGGVVMLVGAMDTGKTTLARQVIEAALAGGRLVGYVDADVGMTTVGPPTCAGLKWLRAIDDLEAIDHADELQFVGSTSPDRLVLPHVVATATLVAAARERADLVVIDTTGTVSGVVGETLKYFKTELCRPDHVVALQRGTEMEPIVGMLRRFFSSEVIVSGVDPDLMPISPEQRAAHRGSRLADAFAPPLERWRVRPTVFAPTLPSGLDLARLHGVLVGVHDGTGRCLGLGVLEHGEDVLRVITNVGGGMQGLRLGSLRVDLTDFGTKPVNLAEVMFGLSAQ
jgi:polynucleotide 5'-kinase involved in rRNA processing